jgi:flagellar biosynthesis regulator FlbT
MEKADVFITSTRDQITLIYNEFTRQCSQEVNLYVMGQPHLSESSDQVFAGHFNNMLDTLKVWNHCFKILYCSYMVMCLIIYPTLLLKRHEYDYEETSWIRTTDIC